MTTETLQSYLVNIGFHVDEITNARFLSKLIKTKKTVLGLGKAAVEAAIAVGVSIEVIAQKYSKIFYLSQITGSSIASLQAFSFAAKQVGVSAGTAEAAISNLAVALRQPGRLPFLQRLFGTSESDPTKLFDKMIEWSKTVPFALAQAAQSMIGTNLDPETLILLQKGQGERLKQQKEFADMQARMGLTPAKVKEIGDQSVHLVRDANMLLATLETFGASWLAGWIKPTDDLIVRLTKAFEWLGGGNWKPKTWLEWLWGPGLSMGAAASPGSSGGGIQHIFPPLPGTMGLKGDFANNLEALMRSMPPELGVLKIRSGWRSHEEQARLRALHPELAAKGISPHERGEAADLEGPAAALNWAHQHAGEYNTRFPMLEKMPGKKYEPWHIEPMGSGGGAKTINNNIHSEIHVDGTSDPKQVAGLVLDGQRRVWSDMVRNMGGVMDRNV